jgi:DNA-binding response OmpR family regulator
MDKQLTTINLLLIEDNPGDANYLRALLTENRKLEFNIKRANRVAEGLELIRQGGIDIVLSDLHLPDSAGMETVQQVRAAAKDVPIIMLTSLDDEEFAAQAVHAGAQDYLVKGDVDAVIMVRAIRYAIERKKLENDRERLIGDLQAMGGLLPVCPSCRRPRDEAGFRERLDEFRRTHPDADFSGSLCPDCAKNPKPAA